MLLFDDNCDDDDDDDGADEEDDGAEVVVEIAVTLPLEDDDCTKLDAFDWSGRFPFTAWEAGVTPDVSVVEV